MQWNLPMINMEKAWDIQPQAGSAITVAVIDTGMAYQNATLTATLPAFTRRARPAAIRRSARVTDPVFGRAAAGLGRTGASRIVAPHDFVERRRRRRSTSKATARMSAARSAS